MHSTAKPSAIHILLVDDHTLFRQGVRYICEQDGQFTVVGEAENGRRAVELTHQLQPDVILMDNLMPEMNGIEATRIIRKTYPQVQVIILTAHQDDHHVFNAVKAGARGYLLKDADSNELITAIHAVYRGEATITPTLVTRVLDEFRRQETGYTTTATPPATQPLTPAEMDVLRYVAQGKSNNNIAQLLAVSEKTVTNRLTSIYRKLNLQNRTQAALYALRQGWATLNSPSV